MKPKTGTMVIIDTDDAGSALDTISRAMIVPGFISGHFIEKNGKFEVNLIYEVPPCQQLKGQIPVYWFENNDIR